MSVVRASGAACLLVSMLACSDAEDPAPPSPPPLVVPAPVLDEIEPAPVTDPYGPMPAEGETDLVMCSIHVVLEDDVVLALGDVVQSADGTLVIACDGGLLALTPVPGRDCRLVSDERFGVEGWLAVPELRAQSDRLALDEDGVVHVVGRGVALGPAGLAPAPEPAPLPSPPGLSAGELARSATDGFVVLSPSAPGELRLLDAAGELRRVVHAGATLDFGLEMIDPSARGASLRGVSNTRERLTYATYEVRRGEILEPGVVRIAGL